MGILQKTNGYLQRATGLRISRHQPRGLHLADDIARDLPALVVETVLDVGANIGQSAEEYLACFPAATVHSIEPAAATCRDLAARFQGSDRFRAYPQGLGATDGSFRLLTVGPSDTFHIAGDDESGTSETIKVQTLDGFLREHAFGAVDFMKIDTEGNDLDVLRGGAGALAAQTIGLVQVEAGMNPENDRHVSLEAMKAYLEGHGYRIFGIYEQVSEFPSGRPNLRRVNAVFASARVIDASKRQGVA